MAKLEAAFSIAVIVVASVATSRADDAKDQAREHVATADTDFKLGRFDEALAEYTKAYELYPAPALLFNLGQCHRNLKNWERAIFFFEGYLRESADATNRDVIEDLIREAREQLAKEQDENLAAAKAGAQHHVVAAAVAEKAGRFPDALRELTLAYALAPEPSTLREIADLRGKLGYCGDAVLLYQRFLDSKPDPAEAASAQQAMARCRLQPAAPKPVAELRLTTVRVPWYTDWLGGTLATAGLASGVTGVVLYRTRDRADTDRRTLSIGLAAGGVALLGMAAIRYVSVDRRRESRIAVTPARGGAIVSWDRQF